MTVYAVPIKDMQFILDSVVAIKNIQQLSAYREADSDLVNAVLDEASRFAEQLIAPLNRGADEQGAQLIDGIVKASPGFAEAYNAYVEGGWGGLVYDAEYGGQGLPHLLGVCVTEMWQSSSLAFALCPMLTASAVSAMFAHASEELKSKYLEKLVSGQWTGTMQLTESQAGTDLAAIKTRATPAVDERGEPCYRLFGQKIFITWGDHSMTDNVLHFVLARIEGAADGIRGLSLFLVPKFCLDENGQPTTRNDIHPLSLEHKLGIHGSPTCVMSLGEAEGAVAYLVGHENHGINCMFTMMNSARLEVGLQGLAVSERAFQQAREYAQERIQGCDQSGQAMAIIEYPDVKRMLLQMKALTQAMRVMVYEGAAYSDFAKHAEAQNDREDAQRRVDLLVPIIKGWCTETSQEVTGLNIQVHGGMGFIEETGAAQHYRDARILTIYEGTTGIQANDLVKRKILRDKGMAMSGLLDEIILLEKALESEGDAFVLIHKNLVSGRTALQEAVNGLLAGVEEDTALAGTAAYNLLMLAGVVVAGWLMAKSALAANSSLQDKSADQSFLQGKIKTARFYASHILPRALMYSAVAQAPGNVVMSVENEQL